jgi:hypothetical protein
VESTGRWHNASPNGGNDALLVGKRDEIMELLELDETDYLVQILAVLVTTLLWEIRTALFLLLAVVVAPMLAVEL